MLSYNNIWRTPSPSTASQSSSQSGRFEVIKKHKKMPRSYGAYNTQRKNSGNLWVPASGWLPHYRCSACREVMSRKIASKCPQKILNCDHIVCANCIVKSYLIELNPVCPVKDCGKCVNPRAKPVAKPAVALPLFFTTDIIPAVEADLTSDFDAEYLLPRGLFDEEPVAVERVHYCGDRTCEWDCGTLDCGCIDVCRGRCGLRDWGW